ncbi:hypothetical protein [Kitasatospora azatica]|uniref:hypothetical protein n=1 Tax=Kitasatospora azatica TaxID=58347 RepID=UPI00055FA237|nr:hypothetical protein [Kitasatospora azatica]
MSQTTIATTPTADRPVTALTGTTAAVYTELCGQERATAAALALAAEVSPSAARKALTALEQRGLARRTPGGNDRTRRLPDHWYPATPGDLPPAAEQETAPAGEAAENADEAADPQRDTHTPANPEGEGDGGTPHEDQVDDESHAPNTDTLPDSPELTADPLAADDLPAEDPAPGGAPAPEAADSGVADPDDGSGQAGAAIEDLTVPMAAENTDEWTEPQRGPETPVHPDGDGGQAPQGDPASEETDTSNTPDATESAELTAHPLAIDGTLGEDDAPGPGATANRPADPESGGAGAAAAGEEPTGPTAGGDAPTVSTAQCCPTCGTHLRPPARKRASTATSGGSRLAPGQLHQMILDHLRANPETDWSPTKISQALGRSSGAISNALVTMVSRGEAVMTCAQPRRYQAAPTATEEAPSGN